MSKPSEFPPPLEQPFITHLIELRDRLLRAVVAVALVFLSLFYFANDLYALLAEPLIRNMVPGTSMIATGVVSPFLTPFKLTLALSVFIAVPYLLYEIWGFVAPALYRTERRLVFPLLVSSTILFYVGMAFAYFVVFPLVFDFLTGVAPEGVAVTPDISLYLDFALKMFFAFGLAFEVPIATVLLIWSGLTTAEDLAQKRPYIIVGAFVVGMLLTPPDVISQTLLALPMWILFEGGLIMSRFYVPKKSAEQESESENTIHSGPETVADDPGSGAHDDNSSPEPAQNYAESDEDYRAMDEDEMDRELDRIEAEEQAMDWDNADEEHHDEFEPIEEERQRLAQEATDKDVKDNDAKDDDRPGSSTDAEKKPE